jgi:hypothetical protein
MATPNLDAMSQPAPTAPAVAPTPAPATADVLAATAATAAPAPAATPAATAAPVSGQTPLPPDIQAAKSSYDQAVSDYNAKVAEPLKVAPVPGVATGPHARLINMISGLALGADSFGKAVATHGREGGVQEVQQAYAQQQAMQIRAQQAAQEQKNAELQQKLTTVQTNQLLMQNHIMLAKLPTELSLTDLTQKQAQQNLSIQQADFAASHYFMSPDEYNAMMTDKGGPTSVTVKPTSAMVNQITQNYQAALKNPQLTENDPYVQGLKTVLENPSSTPRDLAIADQNLRNWTQKMASVIDATKSAQGLTAGAPVSNSQDDSKLRDETLASLGDKDQFKYVDPSTRKELVSTLKSKNLTHQELMTTITRVQEEQQAGAAKSAALRQSENNAKALKEQGLDAEVVKDTRDRLDDLSSKGTHNWARSAQIHQNFDSTLARAKSGDEVASQFMKTMGIQDINDVAGLSRISPSEFQAMDQLGSWPRQLVARLQKAGSGTLPSATLKEMAALNKSTEDAEYKTYTTSAAGILMNAGVNDLSKAYVLSKDGGSMVPVSNVYQKQNAAPSGKAVSLQAAMQLPINKGKTEAQVRADIEAHGHQVAQ